MREGPGIPQQFVFQIEFGVRCLRVRGHATMTYTIHASKSDQTSVTVRINPAIAVDKARALELSGWQVHVTDSSGHLFTPLDFDRLSSFACETA
jgi:hypothetical protein